MGLLLEIGRVGRLANSGLPREAERAAREVERAARALAQQGFALHVEPLGSAPVDSGSVESGSGVGAMRSYALWNDTALHYLRRVAVHLWADGRVPGPGSLATLDDPLAEEYVNAREDPALAAFWSRARASQHNTLDFPHLCLHADASGWYLPIAFPEPVLVEGLGPDPELGEWVGSCVGLFEECRVLAEALELDLERDPSDPELQAAARESLKPRAPRAAADERDGEPDAVPSSELPAREPEPRWRRYGIEAHTCSSLAHAARRALDSGRALALVAEGPRDGGPAAERAGRGAQRERGGKRAGGQDRGGGGGRRGGRSS